MLDNIRVFVRTVELGSFSAAGRTMRLSAAVVSHRIGRLEQQIGCRLFNRTTRKMQLTEQGRVFYENCLDVCQAVERAEASVADRGGAPRGLLKVTAPLAFGRRVVAPLLPQFQVEHPEIDVFLRLSDYMVDLFTEAVDVAVRMAVLNDSSLVVRKIADIDRVLAAAPAYLAKHGVPRRLADLERHNCLLLRNPGASHEKWILQRGQQRVAMHVTGHLDADDGEVLTDWALDGQGIVMKPRFEIASHLASGALEVVLPETPPLPVTLAILHAYQRMVPFKVRAFADALTGNARTYIERELANAPGGGAARRRSRRT